MSSTKDDSTKEKHSESKKKQQRLNLKANLNIKTIVCSCN